MQPNRIRRGVVKEGLGWKAILAAAAITWLLLFSGCACKLTPAQMSKNAEQLDRNADFLLEKIEAGELPTKLWAQSHKDLTAANKALAEAHNADQ